jgi:tetrahydromethanopterin S-methyltransferase subunit G
MPDELDEIRRRLDVLESRMDSEASLRAMMDLDQASLTARFDVQDSLLRALAITQSDHTKRLTRLEDGQRRLETTVGRLEGTVARVEVGLQTIITLLGNDHGA